MDIVEKLFELSDGEYRLFQAKLIPTIPISQIIGVRIPVLRSFAKELYKGDREECMNFLHSLPHTYYEENNLHAFLIEKITDFDVATEETERFLPYIDNWATCDSFSPKCFGKNKEKLLLKIKKWIRSSHTYTVRYAVGMLMKYYLDGDFDERFLMLVSSVKSEEYYIKMMQAWYFATALAKQYDSTVSYITEYKLEPWIHNKTIQKAVESYRISDETKAYLKSFRIKGAK